MPPAAPVLTVPDGWAIDETTRPDTRAIVLAAYHELGVREDPPGSNAGPVLKYGGKPGQPWCAFFASWCVRHRLKRFRPLGAARLWLRWGEVNSAIVPPGAPVLPGDVWVALKDEDEPESSAGHVAIIVGPERRFIPTIGGNERDGVRAWWKRRDRAVAIVRPVPLARR